MMRDQQFRVGHLIDERGINHGARELLVRDGIIREIHEPEEGRPPAPETIDLTDGILLPGLINSHHHAYSALARGIPIEEKLPDFISILRGLWWRLDEVLDADAIRLSAALTALWSVRSGCTTIIDHHSSPSVIDGSLDLIAEEFDRFNLTALLCYEVTDRNGPTAFDQAVTENLRFHDRVQGHPRLRGMFGLHAPLTLSDDSLRTIADRRPESAPIHVHVAEDQVDVDEARALGYDGPLARLHRFGLLDENSLIVHGVHLPENDLEIARRVGVHVALNPESNCNNRVGYSDPDRFRSDRILLGTDGMSSNMLLSMKSADLLYAAQGGGAMERPEFMRRILFENPSRYVSTLLDRIRKPLAVGAPADFAVFPYRPPTPVSADNWTSHALAGVAGRVPPVWVYAGGKPVVADGVCTVIDEERVTAEARDLAAGLWSRFRAHQRGSS